MTVYKPSNYDWFYLRILIYCQYFLSIQLVISIFICTNNVKKDKYIGHMLNLSTDLLHSETDIGIVLIAYPFT